jgi:hypothetical protein
MSHKLERMWCEKFAFDFDKLCRDGPAYGYFPELAKSYLVAAESDLETARELFSDIGVKVVTSQSP